MGVVVVEVAVGQRVVQWEDLVAIVITGFAALLLLLIRGLLMDSSNVLVAEGSSIVSRRSSSGAAASAAAALLLLLQVTLRIHSFGESSRGGAYNLPNGKIVLIFRVVATFSTTQPAHNPAFTHSHQHHSQAVKHGLDKQCQNHCFSYLSACYSFSFQKNAP